VRNVTEQGRPQHQRADARRNRALVLAAAQQLLQNKGMAVQIEEIADAAGVGVATVYRHFGNRDELITEVLRNRVADLGAKLAGMGADNDPVVALAETIEVGSQTVATDRGLAEIACNASEHHGATPVYNQLLPILESKLLAAQATGRVSVDLTASDMLMFITASGVVLGDHERRQRLVGVLLKGIGINQP
jgi:AcrR family transcriptional regulator